MRSLRRFSPNVHTLIAAGLAVVVTLLLVACAGCDAQRLDDDLVVRTAAVPLIVATTTTSTSSPPPAINVAARASRSRTTAVRHEGSRAVVAGNLSELLDRLAGCESGRNPRAVGGGGRFFGAFQDTLATWHAIGGAGNPIDFDYETQKALNARIPVSAWHRQFPVCSRRIGV